MKPIYTNFDKIFGRIFPIGLIIVGVSSCSVSQNTSRENDGIYYDPSATPAEEVVVQDVEYKTNEPTYTYQETQQEPIRIGGKYFDDEGNAPESTETIAYEDSEYYNDDRVELNTNDDYVEWGDDEGVDVVVNNYYNGFGPSWIYRSSFWSPWGYRGWYGPRFGFGFNYGWNAWGSPWGYSAWNWGYSPYFAGGWGWPYYGYGGWYGPYGFYGPYGYGYGYGYYGHPRYYGANNWYRNDYVRDVYRGRGNNNGITRNQSNMGQRELQPKIRRTEKPVATSIIAENPRVETPRKRENVNSPVRNDEIRIQPRTRVRSTNDSPVRVRSNDVRTQSPTRVRTTTPRRRNSDSNINSTPSRNNQRSNSNYSTPSRSSSSFGGTRSSSSSNSSSSGRRR